MGGEAVIHELRDFARRVVAKATELDEVGVLDDWLQVFVELAKDDDEDAAQEQSGHKCDHRCGDGHHAWPSPPAEQDPALDEAIVEECARAGRQGFYVDTGDGDRTCSAWESISPGAREEWRACARAALTHYEFRVVEPLREELAKLRSYTQRAQELTLHHGDKRMELMEENDKLRAELAAERAAGRRYIELTDMAIACGTTDDPSAENCGKCRACALNERDKLRAALKARPAPATDEERKRLADMLRHRAESGGASNTVPVRADDMRRIATLLEEPERRHGRKSLGRRFVLRFEDGEISTRTHYDLHSAEVCASAAGAEIIACDLVPVEEGE
jgi:hypothetical protein